MATNDEIKKQHRKYNIHNIRSEISRERIMRSCISNKITLGIFNILISIIALLFSMYFLILGFQYSIYINLNSNFIVSTIGTTLSMFIIFILTLTLFRILFSIGYNVLNNGLNLRKQYKTDYIM